MARRKHPGGRRRTLAQIAKDAEAADLYRQGLTYPAIAERMGYRSKSSAYDAVQRAIAEAPAANAGDVIEHVESTKKSEGIREETFHVVRQGGIAGKASDRP